MIFLRNIFKVKLLHISLLALSVIQNARGMGEKKQSNNNFSKVELKSLMKKSGWGLKVGERIGSGDWMGGKIANNWFCGKIANKSDVRYFREYASSVLIKSIDECLNKKAKNNNFDIESACANSFELLEEIKNGFWFLPQFRFSKLYYISGLVENKLTAIKQRN